MCVRIGIKLFLGCERTGPTAVGVQQSKSGKKQIGKSLPGITASQQACEGTRTCQ